MGKSKNIGARQRHSLQQAETGWKPYATNPGMSRRNECTIDRALSDVSNGTSAFGCPGPRDPRFEKLVWIPQPVPSALPERTLEDVLRDYPEVQFKGIDESALNLAADAVLRVTDEATWEWLQKWCPRANLVEVFHHIIPEACTTKAARTTQFVVPDEAMAIKGLDTTLAKLFCNCRAVRAKYSALQPINVADIIDNCILLCVVLNDKKRADLFKELKELVQWLPVGLSCKMLNVQKGASEAISRNLLASPSVRREQEKNILDNAVYDYEQHRVQFKVQLLERVKTLLDATAPVYNSPVILQPTPTPQDASGNE